MRYTVSFAPANSTREKSAIIDIRCGLSGYGMARNAPEGYYFLCTITVATEFMAYLREVAAADTIPLLDEFITGFEPNPQAGLDCLITKMEYLLKYLPVFIRLLNALTLKPSGSAPAKEQLIADLTTYLEQAQGAAPDIIEEERKRMPLRHAPEPLALNIDAGPSKLKFRGMAYIISGLLLLAFIAVTVMLVMLAGPMGLLGSFAISTKAALITATVMAIVASVSGVLSGIFMARNCCPLPTNDYQRTATDDISDTFNRDPEARGRPKMQLGSLGQPLSDREKLLGRRDPPTSAFVPDAREKLLGGATSRRNPVGAYKPEYPQLSTLLEAPTFTGFPTASSTSPPAGVVQGDQPPAVKDRSRSPSPTPTPGSALT